MDFSNATWLVSLGLVGLGIFIWAVTWWARRERRPASSRLPKPAAMEEFINEKRRKGR